MLAMLKSWNCSRSGLEGPGPESGLVEVLEVELELELFPISSVSIMDSCIKTSLNLGLAAESICTMSARQDKGNCCALMEQRASC